MLLIWRGYGLLAVAALFPLLASCAGLITVDPPWVFPAAAALSLLVGGAACVYCGTRWNRHGIEHSFYFVPLQAWGWAYLGVVGLASVVAVAGAVTQGLDKPRWLYQGAAGVTGVVTVAATGAGVRRLARSGESVARREPNGTGVGPWDWGDPASPAGPARPAEPPVPVWRVTGVDPGTGAAVEREVVASSREEAVAAAVLDGVEVRAAERVAGPAERGPGPPVPYCRRCGDPLPLDGVACGSCRAVGRPARY